MLVSGRDWYREWEQHLVQVAGDQVHEDVVRAISQLRRRLTELAAERPLAAIRAADMAEKMGKSRAFAAVKTARQAGASWHEIGAEFTRQTAHQRYAALIPGDGRG